MSTVKVKIEIDSSTFIRLFLVAAVFVGGIFVLWKLTPSLMIVLISFFLAMALNAPVSSLANRLPGHSRVLATTVSYIIVLAIIGFFVYVAIPPIVRQTSNFVNSLPSYIEQVSGQKGVVSDIINRYNLQDEVNQFVDGARRQAGDIVSGVGGSVINGVTTVLSGFVTLLTVLVLTFLALIEGPRWLERLWSIYTDDHKLQHHKYLISRMYTVVTRYVSGQVFVATLAGASGLLVLFALTAFFPVPIAAVLPLAFLIFLTDLVPMIGAIIGATIVIFVLIFNDLGAAIAFGVYFFIYQQIENNLIQPTVQARTIELSALTILVAALVGINLLGPVGGFLAIPAAGCIRVLILDYLERRKIGKPTTRRGWGRFVRSKAAES
jgi:predicted PurR-regulated permease PerM